MSREEVPTGTSSLEIGRSSTCAVSPNVGVVVVILRDVCAALCVEAAGVTGRLSGSGRESVERRPAMEEGLAYEYWLVSDSVDMFGLSSWFVDAMECGRFRRRRADDLTFAFHRAVARAHIFWCVRAFLISSDSASPPSEASRRSFSRSLWAYARRFLRQATQPKMKTQMRMARRRDMVRMIGVRKFLESEDLAGHPDGSWFVILLVDEGDAVGRGSLASCVGLIWSSTSGTEVSSGVASVVHCVSERGVSDEERGVVCCLRTSQ